LLRDHERHCRPCPHAPDDLRDDADAAECTEQSALLFIDWSPSETRAKSLPAAASVTGSAICTASAAATASSIVAAPAPSVPDATGPNSASIFRTWARRARVPRQRARVATRSGAARRDTVLRRNGALRAFGEQVHVMRK
jgi:hypothetical protein